MILLSAVETILDSLVTTHSLFQPELLNMLTLAAVSERNSFENRWFRLLKTFSHWSCLTLVGLLKIFSLIQHYELVDDLELSRTSLDNQELEIKQYRLITWNEKLKLIRTHQNTL